jgi:probable rRNA maturation factor
VKLGLVDRRRQPEPAGVAALVAPWDLLCELAAGLGPADWRLDLVLIDDADMAGLNLAYRATDGPTDVLSFSYLEEAAAPGREPVARAGERGARRDLWPDDSAAAPGEGEGPLAGEVVLAPGFIVRRCAERGWAPDQEMALLVVHGSLHILGWDHDDDDERQAMRDLETEVLRNGGLPHPLADGSQEP